MSYDVEYLRFWGLSRYLLLVIIAETPWDIVLEKMAEKNFCLNFCIILYVKNDIFS